MMFIWMHAFLKLTKVAERCEKLGWGATSEYLSWVFDFYLKHISQPVSRTKGRWNITLPSFVESLLYLGGLFWPMP